MSLLSGFLTVILFLDAILLILLVLIQLPKKESGAGLAFGGGASDALFGAGSGTALSHMTKYIAGIFLGLSLILTVLNNKLMPSGTEGLDREIQKQAEKATPSGATTSSDSSAVSDSQTITVTPEGTSTSVETEAPEGAADASSEEEPAVAPVEEEPLQN